VKTVNLFGVKTVNFLEMECKTTKKRSSEFFGQECKNIFLDDREILKTCICGHPRTSLATGIQDPLHASGLIGSM